MSRKPHRKKRVVRPQWHPIAMGDGVFIPSGPPMIATRRGLRPLSEPEAAHRFPGVDFGFSNARQKPRKKSRK